MKKIVLLSLLVLYAFSSFAQVYYSDKDDETELVGYRLKDKELKVKKSSGGGGASGLTMGMLGAVLGTSSQNVLAEAVAGNGNQAENNTLSAPDIEPMTWIIPPMYDDAQEKFIDNLAGVVINGKLGFINRKNQMVIAPQYDNVDDIDGFSQGLAAVEKNGRYGFINKKGETVIDFQFEYAENFKDNYLASVRQDGKWGAIDLLGNLVVPYKYKLEKAMTTVPVTNKDYKEAAKEVKSKQAQGEYDDVLQNITAANKEVNNNIKEIPVRESSDFQEIGAGEVKGMKDKYGRIIIPKKFSEINFDGKNSFFVVKNGLLGVISADGFVVVPPVFNTIGGFSDGSSTGVISGVTGTINQDGKIDDSFLSNLNLRGIQLTKEANYQEAKSVFERIFMLDRNNVAALNNLAFVYEYTKQPSYGIGLLEAASDLAPRNKTIAENYKAAKKAKGGISGRAEGEMFVASGVLSASSSSSQNQSKALVEQQSNVAGASSSSANNVSAGGMTKDEYQSIYDRWARKAKASYDAYNSGTDVETSKKGFNNFKKLMQQAKSDAMVHGYTLTESEVETLSIK